MSPKRISSAEKSDSAFKRCHWRVCGCSRASFRRGDRLCADRKGICFPAREKQRKYSPATLVVVYKSVVNGDPNPNKVCTSYIERANLTVRTHCKRLARLTLAFSKKLENFKAAIALHLAYYNFVKTHGSLRCTPAMAAGIERTHWTIADLVNES